MPIYRTYPVATFQGTDAKPAAKSGGFWSAIGNGITKGLNFLNNVSNTAKTTLDNVGQIRAQIKTAGNQIKADAREVTQSVRDNIEEIPRDKNEDWIKGIPNAAVIGAGAGLLLLVLLASKKKD